MFLIQKLSEYHVLVNSVCNSDVRARSCCSYPRGLNRSVFRDAESPLPQHLPWNTHFLPFSGAVLHHHSAMGAAALCPRLQLKSWCRLSPRTPSSSCFFPCSSRWYAVLAFLGPRWSVMSLWWWWLSQGPLWAILWCWSILTPSAGLRTSVPMVAPRNWGSCRNQQPMWVSGGTLQGNARRGQGNLLPHPTSKLP